MKNILVCKTEGYGLGKQEGIGLGSEGYGIGKTLEGCNLKNIPTEPNTLSDYLKGISL